jgi:beta-phosphoglucomutase-like phosphatase (HAD superfamily)
LKKKGFIFDVDGVIADTPHESAWRESLQILFENSNDWKKDLRDSSYSPAKFTTELYQKLISGKPRFQGAKSALDYFGIIDPDNKFVNEYCEFKQTVFLEKIKKGEFNVFNDALFFLIMVKSNGAKIAAASSSKNANLILEKIDLKEYAANNFPSFSFGGRPTNLFSLFDGNVCGLDLHQGKPSPEIFIKAAESIRLNPEDCVVIEDAVSGVKAAVNGNFYCIGIARLNNEAELKLAGAQLITNDLKSIADEFLH